MRDVVVRWGPLAACAGLLIYHSLQYAFVTDDAYISFVYARNFAEHGQLTFNIGEAVEGYTNFLWTFLLGLLMVVGLPPEPTSLVLGTGFAIGTLAVVYRLGERVWGDRSPWHALAPALLAASSGFACWSSGGLETQMFTFWVSLALYLVVVADERPRAYPWLGVVLALAAITRPEGVLVAGIIAVHRIVSNIARDRRLWPTRAQLWAAAAFTALWLPWFAWRWWYYGHLFPNTYYVKASGQPPPGIADQLIANGAYYIKQWALSSTAIYAAPIAVVGLLVARVSSPRFLYGSLAGVLAAVYLLYTVRVGGDFMGLHRFVMPVFVIVAAGTAFGLRALLSRVPARARTWASAAAVAAVVTAFGISQVRLTRESMRWGNWRSDHGIDTPAYLWVYAHDRAKIGQHMRACFEPDDYSIFGGAGAKPYYAHTRGIDVFGLVSERVAHEVAPTRARAGHNKWAPDSLLLEHDPEFVFSCYSIHRDPARPSFNCSPAFWLRNGYEQVTLHIPGLLQQGEYYSFLAKKTRAFTCAGQVGR